MAITDDKARRGEDGVGGRADADARGHPWWRSPVLVISLGYALLSTLWIYGSDHALALLAGTREGLIAWGVYKGLGFVGVTAGFLFLLLRKTYGALEASNRSLRGHERELRRLGRLKAALSHINQAIVRLPVREELFQRVCEVLVEHGGFRMAWIGWQETGSTCLAPVATAGDTDGYVKTLRIPTDDSPAGRGPSGRAFREGRPYVCSDLLSDPATLPWREAMALRGLRSSVALPIREGGRIRGVLSAYSSEPGFFRDSELALLAEAAEDIAFALDALGRDDERRRAEALAAAERRFSATMIDSMPGVLYFYDETGAFLRWNRNFELVSGRSGEEIARMHPLDFIAEEDRDRVRVRIGEVFSRGESLVEAAFLTKDGRRIPYFFTGRRVEFDGRRCLVGSGIDITERRHAEEALRESEERFRETFEKAAVGIAHVSPDGRFRWVNDQLCAIAGHTREQLAERTFAELTVPEDRAESEAAHRAMLAGERDEFAAEKRYRRADGEIVWVSVAVKLLRDAAGLPHYFVVVVSDIGERKRLEQQFLRAQRLESIGTLAGGIAHDLNNLLAPIMMGVEMLRLGGTRTGEASVLDNMELSARRAAGLVRQVLSFARGVEGARARLDLRDVARETEAFVTGTFPRNIAWRADIAPDLWPVIGDATQLNQVLLNLCVNARDAMPRGGALSLRAFNAVLDGSRTNARRGETSGRHVVIEVADEGCGMGPELRDRIFEPFFTTKAPGKGTGLGLSTVLGIVRGHGGRVEVDSAPGHGTTFRVFLPAIPEKPGEGAARPAAERPRGGAGELVLVVDDESSILEVTRQMLVAFGYRVLVASDGAEAVAIFARRREEVAAVVADLRMPAMEGAELIASLRGIDPAVPVIGVGGGAESSSDAKEATGIVLARPFAADTLLLALGRALAARERSASREANAGRA